MRIELLPSLAKIEPESWDRLCGEDDPFCEYAFLRALEVSGSVGANTGWLPMHVTLWRGERLCAALPLYLKQHSFGEYIFDFSWASAAERAGIAYYPKLVSMVPFTPATGRRFLYAEGEDPAEITHALLAGALGALQETGASSLHLNFLNGEERTHVCEDPRFLYRLSTQFHWHNAGYQSFDEHLASFRSVVRKEVRKERRRALESGLSISVVAGSELLAEDFAALNDFYFDTSVKHGSTAYLTREFFTEIQRTHSQRVVAVLAKRDGRTVAGALNFEKGKHLYGRYWGAHEAHDFLHFEVCYHRLIERAIERGHTRFEAGAQGSHKLRRGLLPGEIHNACYIADPWLQRALADYLLREERAVRAEMAALLHHGPSHRESEAEPR